jgi:CO/xanthine dehydrogenase FAD-binding subunit
MISLTAALDGVCTIWKRDGGEQRIKIADFVTGDQRNVLAAGELLRQIDIPLAALKRRSAFRQISLTPLGRSAALLIGSISSERIMALTVIDGAPPPPIPEAERDRVAKLLTNTIKLAFGGAR